MLYKRLTEAKTFEQSTEKLNVKETNFKIIRKIATTYTREKTRAGSGIQPKDWCRV